MCSENSRKKIGVYYLPGSPELEQTERGDWIDLYVYEDVTLKAGEGTCISQGIAMQLPQGYEAIMAPRSSTFKRWGLLQTNGIGIIDNSYCSKDDIWMFPALATRDVIIPKGTRICQFRIIENQPKITFTKNFESRATRGGFGSSGV